MLDQAVFDVAAIDGIVLIIVPVQRHPHQGVTYPGGRKPNRVARRSYACAKLHVERRSSFGGFRQVGHDKKDVPWLTAYNRTTVNRRSSSASPTRRCTCIPRRSNPCRTRVTRSF